MKAIKLIVLVLAATTLAACAGSDSGGSNAPKPAAGGTVSVNSDGTCTTDYVSDYNSVHYEAVYLSNKINMKYSDSEILHQLQTYKNACDRFFSKHSGVSCKAVVEYKDKMVSSDDHKEGCNKAAEFLAEQK